MAIPLFPYVLSQEADKDLDEIFDYTFKQFGIAQAAKYLNEFEVVFTEISKNPKIGRPRNEVLEGLNSVSKKSHTIFYRIMNNNIRIV